MEGGLNPNLSNWLGITRLHRCAAMVTYKLQRSLLDVGADINSIETEWYSTPLGWAARTAKSYGRMVIEKRSRPSQPKNETWALPLAWAERRGYKEIAEYVETIWSE
jgi:ankyrin repeat protein